MPEVPQLQSCCFILSTETGSKIIGWIMAVAGILGVAEFAVALVNSLGHKTKDSGYITDIVINLIVYVLLTLLAVYLLIGIYQRNMSYVRLWIRVVSIYCIVLFVLVCLGIILFIIGRGQGNVIQTLVTLVIITYFVLVVHSYYRESTGSGATTY